jgi:membrane-bound serine protease (ClpP class)
MKALAPLVAALLIPIVALGAEKVATIKIDGPIGPTTESYIARAVRVAGEQKAQCLIIQLDTPGGLLDSTKGIVQDFLASPVPTVVYVSPSGATAASAGCFITLAADVAAMAPTTTIGAAHPVELGGGSQTDETMKTKLENYAASYIESIAARRNRNVEWARSSVKDSASITADQALEKKVVEIVARDMPDLLQQLQGREINGHKLQTSGATVVEIRMTAAEQIFQRLWRPEVMFVLMLVAIYGLIGEVSNPGVVLPGVAGAIALILALYMAAILPVNAAGLAFIGLAVLLFVVDLYAPTHGILTGGGIVAFLLGSLLLFDHAEPTYRLSLTYILPGTVITGLFFLFVVGKGLAAQRLPVRAGKEVMIGKTVPALTRIDRQQGKVFIEGEYWNAVSDEPIDAGKVVEVAAVHGLTLQVKPSMGRT